MAAGFSHARKTASPGEMPVAATRAARMSSVSTFAIEPFGGSVSAR
jgi:hypothetical protein